MKKILLIVMMVLFVHPEDTLSFNLDKIDGSAGKDQMNPAKKVKGKITKEAFFSALERKASLLETTTIDKYDIYRTFYVNTNNPGDWLIELDENGNFISESESNLFDDAVLMPIPNPFALDMILTNSYGLNYQPSEHYLRSSSRNYKQSYYRCCAGSFEGLSRKLVRYYTEKDGERYLDDVKKYLKEWKNPKFISAKPGNQGDCYGSLLKFANDYNEFIRIKIPEVMSKNKTHSEQEKKSEQLALAEKKRHDKAEQARVRRLQQEEEQKKRIAEEKKRQAESENKRLAEEQHHKKIIALTKKWERFGLPEDILTSYVATYAGVVSSGNITTLVEFIDAISHSEPILEKHGQHQFLIRQESTDIATEEVTKVTWVFFDLRKDKGYIWLERAVFNGQDYPSENLRYLVGNMLRR